MKPHEAVAILKQVTYKPNWTISPELDGPRMAVVVRFTLQLLDVRAHRGKHPEVPIFAEWLLPWSELDLMDEPELLDRLGYQIDNMEDHETAEWLRYKGRRLRPEPHSVGR